MRSTTALAALALAALAAGALADEGKIEMERPLPERVLPTVERDGTVSLAGFRGKKVLLIEFASW